MIKAIVAIVVMAGVGLLVGVSILIGTAIAESWVWSSIVSAVECSPQSVIFCEAPSKYMAPLLHWMPTIALMIAFGAGVVMLGRLATRN